MVKNEFGGPWTIRKVEVIEKYLRAYQIALSKFPTWRKVYLDPFAGTGSFIPKGESREYEGSALRALKVEPQFDHYVFCEKDEKKWMSCDLGLKRDFLKQNAVFIATMPTSSFNKTFV